MSNMVIALQITALGMGLVFGAIILLWWMMALLTSVAAEKEASQSSSATASDSVEMAPVMKGNVKARVAAAAVAMAMADHQITHTHPLSTPPTAIVSAWQLGMRTRQMSEKGTSIVRRPRNEG